jgi:hypothetical protein
MVVWWWGGGVIELFGIPNNSKAIACENEIRGGDVGRGLQFPDYPTTEILFFLFFNN